MEGAFDYPFRYIPVTWSPLRFLRTAYDASNLSRLEIQQWTVHYTLSIWSCSISWQKNSVYKNVFIQYQCYL